MLQAYRRGIFPMPVKVDRRRLIAWLAPDPRGTLEFHDLHISRRLARRLKRGEFSFSVDTAFAAVIEGCAAPRGGYNECWLTLSMQNAYVNLHQLGHAHSVEVWHDGLLVGGLFGVAVGRVFAAESMFTRLTDASKAGLAYLVDRLQRRGFDLLDVQWTNAHTRSLGAKDIAREQYLARLKAGLTSRLTFS
jgi:leucyl/phenylalanyl-tRNA--protein transferase